MTGLDAQANRARAAREALVGTTIAGKYALRSLIGHGGMGAVYEAENVAIGKRVAIKFVDPEYAADETVVARFAREARAMSAIESPHIVSVFDAGTESGRPFLVMELLRGEDLGERLRRRRTIPKDDALHIVAQVLKGLARAHAAGIVHRDLKPDNVFLLKNDSDPLFAKIVDFGVSKIDRPRAKTVPLALTGRGTVLGTPFYMSPEQAQASPDVDARTDLYSVGAILFECLSGRPPHTGETYEQVILSICMRDAPDLRSVLPSIDPAVADFLARALARDRAQRFPTAHRMLAAIHEIAPAERTRVPVDEVSGTLLSAGSPGFPASSGAMPAARDAALATRIGVGTLESNPKVAAADVPSRPEAPASNRLAATRVEGKGAIAGTVPTPESAPVSTPSRPSADVTRGRRLPVVLTAVLAMFTGTVVTFAVIAAMSKPSADRRPSQPAAPPQPTLAVSTGTRPDDHLAPSRPSSTEAASPEPATTPSAPTSSATAPSTGATPRPRGDRAPNAPPKSSNAKALDIQRDLP